VSTKESIQSIFRLVAGFNSDFTSQIRDLLQLEALWSNILVNIYNMLISNSFSETYNMLSSNSQVSETYNLLISNSYLCCRATERLVLFPTWLMLDLLGAGHVEHPWVRTRKLLQLYFLFKIKAYAETVPSRCIY